MNIAIMTGRLTRDPEVRVTQNGNSVATFSLAVDRRYKKEGQPTADFISCVAWGRTAETIGQYCAKGKKIGVEGRIQTRTYETNDGSKRYVTEVIVDSFEFLESKSKSEGSNPFGEPVPEEEIPF